MSAHFHAHSLALHVFLSHFISFPPYSHKDRRFAYVFGVEAHVCLLQTALDLLRRGYTVLVVEDAVRSQRPNDCEQALRRMRDAGCIVTTAESCLYELMGDAKHPSFKALLPFVKEHAKNRL